MPYVFRLWRLLRGAAYGRMEYGKFIGIRMPFTCDRKVGQSLLGFGICDNSNRLDSSVNAAKRLAAMLMGTFRAPKKACALFSIPIRLYFCFFSVSDFVGERERSAIWKGWSLSRAVEGTHGKRPHFQYLELSKYITDGEQKGWAF